MGYYIRVLGTDDRDIPLSSLQDALNAEQLRISATVESGNDRQWNQLVLAHPNGPQIVSIERNPVVPGGLGDEELQEFLELIQEAQPASAVRWLSNYLPTVKVIYALQILSGTEVNDGWRAVGVAHRTIWSQVGGILQSDGEGFSNEEGHHILWQFSDDVEGPWEMALLDADGNWAKFKMNLGDRKQRQAFLEGRIPPKAEMIPD